MTARNVLFVLTSHEDLGDVRKTGFHVNEAASMWTVFTSAGCHVTLASVAGGKPPQDRRRDSEAAQAFLADDAIAAQLLATASVADIDLEGHDAVVYVGGHGAMWDFPGNDDVARVGAAMFERGGVVAAICHGPAALVDLTLSDGTHLVAGRKLAAFTNDEERAVELAHVVPFMLQDALVSRGAVHVPAPEFTEHVVVDGRLVTGQNPQSAVAIAKLVIATLDENRTAD